MAQLFLFLGIIASLISGSAVVGQLLTKNNETCVNHADCLQKDIFTNYNRLIRPVKNNGDVVNITITLVLNNLMDIKEKDEMMVVVGFFRTIWYDQFLVWDPQNYGGITYLILAAEQIWLPDTAISNSASHFYDISHKRDFHVQIDYDGKIRWSWGGIFASNCNINLKEYPFDSQSCQIEVENWMYTLQDVDLDFTPGNAIDESAILPNAVWQFESSEAVKLVKYERFGSLQFTLVWKRKTLYYYVNILIPIVLMLLVSLGVFWLPADCGEKMSLAITTLLAFSVFQIIIMENTPVNSDDVPNITAIVMLVTCTATTSLLISMIVVYISRKSPNKRPPKWVRIVAFKYLARILCLKKGATVDVHETTPIKEWDSDSGPTVISSEDENLSGLDISKKNVAKLDNLSSIEDSLKRIRKIIESQVADDSIRDEWILLGIVIDRVAFCITLVVMLSSLIYIVA